MLARIQSWLTPPVFEDDEDKTRTVRLLNMILWVNLAVWLLGLVAMPLAENPLAVLPILGVMILLGFLALALMRAGRIQLAGGLFSILLWAATTGLLLVSEGLESPMILGYASVVIVAALLLGSRAALAFTGLAIATAAGISAVESSGFLPPALIPTEPISTFAVFVGNILVVAGLLYIAVRSLNEALGRARRYAAELEGQREHLEKTVERRTQDLSRRTRYLEATAAIARDTASVLDLQEQLVRVVNLVSEQFGLYHTGIFLLDPSGEWAVLQAASSEGGGRMLARNHRLQMGVGIVGHVAEMGKPRVALDVGEDAVFFENPDLPDTRSEMALPLRARGEIIGALDVQSTEPAAFGEEDVAVLQTLADQVALAISNTRLFQQAQESLLAERRAYGELSRQAWQELLLTQRDLGVLRDERGLLPADDFWTPQMDAVLHQHEAVTGSDGEAVLALPISVRDQVIGVVDLQKPGRAGAWTQEEIMTMKTLVSQLGVALDGARLHQDTQRRAARDRMLGEIAGHMRESLDLETVLHTAASEMRRALALDDLVIRLATPEFTNGNGE